MGNEASAPIPYNVQAKWRKLVSGSAAVPAGREGQVAASWENKLYIFGGGSSGGTQRADVWTFDLDSSEWKEVATSGNAPSARTGACAAIVDGRMFVFGGMDMERGFLDDFCCFNIAEGTWEQVQGTGEGPTPRDKSAVCVVGKKLYFFGGFGPVEAEVEMPDRDEASTNAGEDGADDEGDEDEYEDEGPAMSFNWFDDLFVYDTESKAWEQVQASGDIPSPRAAFGMDVVGGSIYVFGGRDTTKRQNDLYVLDTTTNTWTKPSVSGAVPAERSFHSFTSLAPAGKQQLVLFGGLSSTNALLDDVHVFDIATSAWVQPTIAVNDGRVNARRFHSAVLHNRSLVVFGGSSNFSPDTQECLTFHSDTFALDLGPILEAAPVTIPPPPAAAAASTSSSSSAAPSVSFTSPSASTEGGAAGDATRGKKRKSDEIEEGEKKNEEGGEKEEEEKKRE